MRFTLRSDRNDEEQLGPVTIDEPRTVERPESARSIQKIAVDAIRPSPYSVHDYEMLTISGSDRQFEF